jgi:Bacteriocin-protection, YdeI or OmpD-Associated/Domain of unknown function (DUF1905)
MKFRAAIEINNINPYVLVNAARAKRLKSAWKKPMPVLVQVNGRPDPPWRINMMPVGDGSFYLYLHGDVRKAAAVEVGDNAEISVSFDENYRNGPVHEMPEEFARRLAENPAAQDQWHRLPPSRKKEVLRYLVGLKTEDAKNRNVDRAMRVLSGSRERFMARDWNSLPDD